MKKVYVRVYIALCVLPKSYSSNNEQVDSICEFHHHTVVNYLHWYLAIFTELFLW